MGCFCLGYSQADRTLLPAKEKGLWGYIDLEKNWVISPRYNRCLPFEDRDYTWAQIGSTSYLIDKNGDYENTLTFANVVSISNEVILYRDSSKLGWYNRQNTHTYTAEYKSIKYIAKLQQLIIETAEGFGVIDLNNEEIILPVNDAVWALNDVYGVRKESKNGVLSVSGDTILPLQFKNIEQFENYYVVRDFDEMQSIYFTNGKLMLSGSYDYLDYLTDDYFAAQRNGSWQLIYANDGTVRDSLARFYTIFGAGLISVFRDNIQGIYATEKHDYLLQPIYQQINTQLNSTNYITKQGDLKALYAADGTPLTPHKYTFIGQYESPGFSLVRNEYSYGAIDSLGNEMLPCEYSHVALGEDHIAKAKRGNLISMYEFDENWKMTDSVLFKNSKTMNLGGTVSMSNARGIIPNSKLSDLWFLDTTGRWGLRDSSNTVVVRPVFSEIIKLKGSNYVLGVIRTSRRISVTRSVDLTQRAQYALIDEINFKKVTPYNLKYIDTANIRDTLLQVFRVMMGNGYMATVRKDNGKMIAYQSKYIGDFTEGYARIFVGTKWFAHTSRVRFVGVIPVLQYANEFNFRVTRSRYTDKMLYEGVGYWAYIGPDGKYIRHPEYFKDQELYGAADFKKGRAIVMKKDSSHGMLNYRGNYVLQPIYKKIEYLAQANDTLLLTETKSTRYGYVTTTGELIASPQYRNLKPFSNGFAWAYSDGSTTLLSKQGEVKTMPGRYKTSPFSNGYAGYAETYRYAVIDSNWNMTTPFLYSKVGSTSQELIPVRRKGTYGYLDESGQYVIQPQFSLAEPFVNGIALVRLKAKNGKAPYGYINVNGDFVIKPKYQKAWTMNDKGYAIVKKNGKLGVINSLGKKVIPTSYKKVYLNDGKFVGANAMKCVVYDSTGKKIKRIVGRARDGYHDGVLVVQRTGRYATYDTRGNKTLPYKYKGLRPFENGVSACQKARTITIIDTYGDTLSTMFGLCRSGFSAGFLVVKQGNSYAYLDKYGNNRFNLTFQKANPFQDGLAIVKIDGKYGTINTDGFYQIEPTYDYIAEPTDGVSIVASNSTFGVCDLNNKYLISPECNAIDYDPAAQVFRYTYKNAYGYFTPDGQLVWEVK